MHNMTLSDLLRRGAGKIKSNYRRTRIWKVDDLKIGYIAVPKVASSSIRSMITAQQKSHLGQEKHKTPNKKLKYCARISLTPAQIVRMREQFYLFSFTRNPLTRLYSCYRDKVVNGELRHDRCCFSPYRIHFGISFDEFIRRVVDIPEKSADQHFRSLCSFLVHDGKLLVDYVGKFERFAQDWDEIATRFGLPQPKRARRVSGSPVAMKDIPLSSAGLELVIARYAQDLDTFGYRKELEAMRK